MNASNTEKLVRLVFCKLCVVSKPGLETCGACNPAKLARCARKFVLLEKQQERLRFINWCKNHEPYKRAFESSERNNKQKGSEG
jgi:hypothetical protein